MRSVRFLCIGRRAIVQHLQDAAERRPIVSKQVEFFFIVHRFGSLGDVTFSVLVNDFDAALDMQADATGCPLGVRCGIMARTKVEFEPFSDSGLEGRHLFQKIDRFRPGFGMCIMNQGFTVKGQGQGKNRIVVFAL